ncbi:hypothetical protein F5Y14DRAFT_217781 [Nemania sp. NC0429]|nr:hypothetical protein F5Y14DRAFT_217781 [Nemania sp. NC0429]
MEDIYQSALAGTLTADRLKGDQWRSYIHHQSKLTLLSAAVWKGHKDLVKLLLEKGADPNKEGELRPPLWVAASKTKTNAGHIIDILLNHKADPTLPSVIDDGSTPLLVAVKTYKSPAIISKLVDAGASPEAANGKGETPRQVATNRKDRAQLQALLPRSQRTSDRLPVLAMLTGLILFVVAWANNNIMAATIVAGAAGVATAALKNRFNISGLLDHSVLISPDQRTAKQFREDMRDYIDKTNLGRFFPPGSDFLEKVVTKAVYLDSSPNNTLDVHDLTRLALYQPVLYCDDSGSMQTDNRQEHQRDLVERITSITTRLVPDGEGIELRFINTPTDHRMTKPNLSTINNIMTELTLNGATEIGTNLRSKILKNIIENQVSNGGLKRPVLISIITDGHPEGPPGSPERHGTLKQVITECGTLLRNNGYDPKVVRFQISQIGSDEAAGAFLTSLNSDTELRDVLYCTAQRLDTDFQTLRDNESRLEQWLLELLMGPIMDADAS